MKKLDLLSDGNKYVKYKDCSNLSFGDSLADPTYYVSSSEAVKRVKDNSNVQGHYDFANGIDDGTADSFVSLRRRGIDLAEISQKMYKDTVDAQEEFNSLKENIKKDTIERMKRGNSDTPSSPVSPASPASPIASTSV